MKMKTIQECLDRANEIWQKSAFKSKQEKECIGMLRAIRERQEIAEYYREELQFYRRPREKWSATLDRLRLLHASAQREEHELLTIRDKILVELPRREAAVAKLKDEIRDRARWIR